MNGSHRNEPELNEVVFFPLTQVEIHRLNQRGVSPCHLDYSCGMCGLSTNGRVAARLTRASDRAVVSFCVCSCPKKEPTCLVEQAGKLISQAPIAREYHPDAKWPKELAQLYDEASKSFAAGAFTASSMACRKLLMACACQEGETDGKSFTQYVDFITSKVLPYPKAKAAVDAIRSIGNEANHRIQFVSQDDARRSLEIITYLLNAIYSFPAA